MKVCLICVELFAWGKYGGFGRATRLIGRELVRRGLEVFAVVPKREGQQPVEQLDGMTVLSFPPKQPWASKSLFTRCNADIYHSCEPSLGTHFAMQAMPHKKHMITMRDTRDYQDWKLEYTHPSLGKLQVLSNFLYEDNFLVKRAVRRAHAVYCAAQFLIPKVKKKYTLRRDPVFLPTPVTIPQSLLKSERPTVCYMGRLDRRERPELFMELAKSFPDVQFIAVGSSRDQQWDSYLRETYSHVQNLEMPGFLDQFVSDRHSQILGKSWVMVNTAVREGLPNSFLEATAHGCAILSAVNPDGFASEFGFHVKDGRFDEGLRYLLKNRRWEEQGNRGRLYVQENFELDHAITLHIELYDRLINDPLQIG